MRELLSAFVWKQNGYKNFVGIPEAKIQFGRPQDIVCKYNIKMDPTLIGCEDVDPISFPDNKKILCVFVYKVMKLGS